jgi:hypothetical protein
MAAMVRVFQTTAVVVVAAVPQDLMVQAATVV